MALYKNILFPEKRAFIFLLCICANHVNLWTGTQGKLRNISIYMSRMEQWYAYNLYFLRLLKTELHCMVTENEYIL